MVEQQQKSYPLSLFLGDQKQKTARNRLHKNVERKDEEMRSLLIKCGVLDGFDGSAYVELGKTKLICTVTGPLDLENESSSVKGAENLSETINRASVQVEVEFSPFCSLEAASSGSAVKDRQSKRRADESQTEEERHLAVLLKSALMPVVCLEKYPKSLIELRFSVLQNDGGVLGAAVCCASAALCNASVELFDLLIGASLVALDTEGEKPRILIDPESSEIDEILQPTDGDIGVIGKCTNRCLITVGLMPSLGQVSLFDQQGFSNAELVRVAFEEAQIACRELYLLLKAKIKLDIIGKDRIS